jgi:hypothetical protein
MVQAHAVESGRALQHAGATGRIDAILDRADAMDTRRREANAAAPAASHRRRAQKLNVCAVGLMVAIGGVVYVPEAGNKASGAGREQPPAVAAGEALHARSAVIGNTTANDKPMDRPLQAGEPGGARTIGVEEAPMDEGGIETQGASDAHSNDGAVATPVAGPPIEQPGSDTENRAHGAAEERMPSEVVRTAPIAPATIASLEEPSQRDESSSPPLARETALRTAPIAAATNALAEQPPQRNAPSSPPPALETSSKIDRAKDPVAVQVGQVISGVNMRAGPSNGQPVLTTIPRGSPIEVIECRHWCEVIFAGQRGWVYKTFVSAPLADGAMSRERTKPSPRKAGSNNGVLRTTRTRASDPHRPKPVAARLSANQSARDARCRSQSSSGMFLWGAVEYLWNQLRPTAAGSDCD